MKEVVKMPLGFRIMCFFGLGTSVLTALLSLQKSNNELALLSMITFLFSFITWFLIKLRRPKVLRILFGILFISAFSSAGTFAFSLAVGAKMKLVLTRFFRLLIALSFLMYLYRQNVLNYFKVDVKKIYSRSRWVISTALVLIFGNGLYTYINATDIKKDVEEQIEQIDAIKEAYFESEEGQQDRSESV